MKLVYQYILEAFFADIYLFCMKYDVDFSLRNCERSEVSVSERAEQAILH